MAAMQPRPAWKTYLFVTLAMLPTLVVWLFWLILLVPKFRSGWDQGTAGSQVEYLHAPVFIMVYYSHKAFLHAPLVLAGVVFLLVILELTLKKWWPRWRLRVLTGLAVLFNALFMVTICFNMVLCLMLVQVSQKGIESLEKSINKSN